MSGSRNLHWYCFWRRYDGLLYGWRAFHPTTGRLVYVYGGKTFQRFETRIRQHMWGGGRYDSVPKPWADTVPGWRPNGTPEEIIAAGGVFLIRKPGLISPFNLWWQEIVFAIWLRRPYYNDKWNRANHRRIPISVQYRQREARDRGEVHSGVGHIGRAHLAWLSARRTVTVALSMLALVGVLAVTLTTGALGYGVDHIRGVVGVVLVGGGALMYVLTEAKPTRRRRRRRVTTRRRR